MPRRKAAQSYGVPVRAAAPVAASAGSPPGGYQPAYQQPTPAYQYAASAPPAAPPWEVAPAAPPAGFYAPVIAPAPNPYAPLPSWSPTAAPAPYGHFAPGFGGPPMPPPHRGQPGMRKPFKIAAGAIGALILVGAVWGQLEQRSPVKAPASLAGYPLSTDPELTAETNKTTAEIKRDNAGNGAIAAHYTDSEGRVAVTLFAVRGLSREAQEVSDMEANGVPIDRPSRRNFGGATCFRAEMNAVCIWHGDISGGVFVYGDDDLFAAGAIASEAQSALR